MERPHFLLGRVSMLTKEMYGETTQCWSRREEPICNGIVIPIQSGYKFFEPFIIPFADVFLNGNGKSLTYQEVLDLARKRKVRTGKFIASILHEKQFKLDKNWRKHILIFPAALSGKKVLCMDCVGTGQWYYSFWPVDRGFNLSMPWALVGCKFIFKRNNNI